MALLPSERLRHAQGSPNCLIDIGYASSAGVLRSSFGELLEYTRHSLALGTENLVRASTTTPNLASRVVEVACAGVFNDPSPTVSGVVNLSTTKLSKFSFESEPVYFSRLRASGCWEMLVYSQGSDEMRIHLGVPKTLDMEQVTEVVALLLPIKTVLSHT